MKNAVDHAPVAVVLGARVWADGKVSASLRRRAEHAANLWLAAKVRAIIACGDGRTGISDTRPSEAQAIAEICRLAGVPEGAIFLEEQSGTTEENLRFARPVLKQIGAKGVMIVTDRYHAPRARLVARRIGLNAQSSCPTHAPLTFRTWIRLILREIAAYVWYALSGKGGR
ncbi:MAG: YdcF family protein [Pelagimonas sp.]|jgi:uncharacterized SAM-binding protein YcdF (DUF218 family)|nr:YdcF family protein [Pelagimonas sp.]